MKLLVINGPNINFLGIREPDIYGANTYKQLLDYIREVCSKEEIEVSFFQSNHEGEIVDAIQDAYYKRYDGIVINPAAYTHTSVAILDALKAVGIPTVEVHLSDIYSRDLFRHVSYVSLVAEKTIYGKGFEGYKEAVLYLKDKLR
ncbi:MAG: type II 3-dehydroquinate dehydratase [Clostridia bacterium]|nr:type II 3-dehydroquinate dehydratase [Clostridia bacterium]MBR3295869.1 type II 3-dehydroquinate dehydratase [Clostridia bacterium]